MTKKIYAVRVGRTTGVFNSWAECRKQVDGFPAARYKSFTDLAEALQWLNGTAAPRRVPAASTRKSPRPAQANNQQGALRPDSEQDFVIYTDGSCLRNPNGPGGWAAVIREVQTGKITELTGGDSSTTNNRMELSAAIAALSFPENSARIALYTDSQYLKNGFTRHWLAAWKKRGWKKADGQPVLNQDLWEQLDASYATHDVTFHWVKGHVGVELNERCDRLAKREAMKFAH
ncbi:MAG: ribonuclease HI [Selenomonadaceae bacterium]|nr:ribonuclease HI [Selenomonadaceae bacterium]